MKRRTPEVPVEYRKVKPKKWDTPREPREKPQPKQRLGIPIRALGYKIPYWPEFS